MKTNTVILLFSFLVSSATFLAQSAVETTAVIRTKAASPPQRAVIRGKDGSTNEVRGFLQEELHSVARQGTGHSSPTSTRTKVAIIAEGQAERERWSYWPPNFPLAYDFTMGTSPTGTIVAFAKNYSIGILEVIDGERPSLSDRQPAPYFIDLRQMIGEDAFAPDEHVVTNALTRNLRVVRVAWQNGWVITIRAKGGTTYELAGTGSDWRLQGR